MTLTLERPALKTNKPINIMSKEFGERKYEYYDWMLHNAPVTKGKMSVVNTYLISKYDDCVSLLKDRRLVRDRSTATGRGGKFPFPVPKSVGLIANSMITEDEPNHRRLRDLVHKAFTPKAIADMVPLIESYTHQLLDSAEAQGTVNLEEAFSLPIPVKVIATLLGIPEDDMPFFQNSMRVLSDGMTGFSLVRTFAFDIRKITAYMGDLIERKRQNPANDIMTGLIQAESDGDRLSEDELIAMSYLLIFAGYETTVHLLNNAVVTLTQHPDQLELLRSDMSLIDSAVEEILRFNGPIQGTKPNYITEDIEVRGVRIPKKSMIMPMLGAANRDPDVFDNPTQFDITRSPNKQLGFGQGIHYCLGAPLARLEATIALRILLERNPNLQLAIPHEELTIAQMPLWHRYNEVPVRFG